MKIEVFYTNTPHDLIITFRPYHPIINKDITSRKNRTIIEISTHTPQIDKSRQAISNHNYSRSHNYRQ